MSGVPVRARAKLNLSLDVMGKRGDGLHELRMVMQSCSLADDVSVELAGAGDFSAHTNRVYIPTGDKNIAVKAARAFYEELGREGGAHIRITKRIPVCAGLGGGSTDAAAVLNALNALHGAALSARQLHTAAMRAGSDVPFCLEGGTALAEGRGEVLTPLPPLPRTPIVICMPHFSCSTPELFARIDARKSRCHPDTAGLIDALKAGDVAGVARRMYNVFEDVLEPRAAKAVNEIKLSLLDNGALGAAMTGSGSAVFGLFPDEETARRAHAAAKERCREAFLAVSE